MQHSMAEASAGRWHRKRHHQSVTVGQTFIIKLNNYVVQLIGLASVLSRRGSFTIFLLLNDSSHDAHFSTRQNMKPGESLEKKSNFSLHGFSRYLTSNMALQKIILTSFFFVFLLLLPDRGLCVLRAITSRRC